MYPTVYFHSVRALSFVYLYANSNRHLAVLSSYDWPNILLVKQIFLNLSGFSSFLIKV